MANKKNLANGILDAAIDTDDTSFPLQSGHGDRMPSTPFYITVTPRAQVSNPDTSEIMLVTGISTDTLTVTRAQYDTTAKSFEEGAFVVNGIYVEDIEEPHDRISSTETELIATNNSSDWGRGIVLRNIADPGAYIGLTTTGAWGIYGNAGEDGLGDYNKSLDFSTDDLEINTPVGGTLVVNGEAVSTESHSHNKLEDLGIEVLATRSDSDFDSGVLFYDPTDPTAFMNNAFPAGFGLFGNTNVDGSGNWDLGIGFGDIGLEPDTVNIYTPDGGVIKHNGIELALVTDIPDVSGKLDSVVAGTNITIDNTDPNNPIISSSGGGGSGDVVGPSSSTDNAIVRFDSTTGKLVQNSTATISDSGGISTTIANTGNSNGLTITQNDTTNNPRAIEITNAGTNKAIFIDQNGNAGTAVASSGAVFIENTGNIGIGLNVYSNIDGTASGPLVQITHDNTAADTEALTIQQDGTGPAMRVNHNGTGQGMIFDTASTGSAGVLVRNNSAIRTGSGSASLMVVQNVESTGSGDALTVIENGPGKGIVVDHNNTNISFDIDRDVTNKNNPNESIRLVHTSVVTDGGTYTKSGAAVNITSNVVETSGTITDSAAVLDIDQTHADSTGIVVDIGNAGTGFGMRILQTGSLASNQAGLLVQQNSDLTASSRWGSRFYTNVAHTAGRLVEFNDDNASSALGSVLHINADGATANGVIFIDNNNTSRSLNIDQDGSSASQIQGVVIDVDNASTGGAIGMQIANVTATSGQVIGLRVDAPSGGTTNYAIQLSSTGGTEAGGITFGTDTNLYRFGNNILKTDDKLVVGTGLEVSGTILQSSAAVPQVTFINTSSSSAGSGSGFLMISDDGAALASGDRMGFALFGGSYDASAGRHNASGIVGYTTEAWSSTARGAELRMEITANGATARSTAAVFGQNKTASFYGKVEVASDDLELNTASKGVILKSADGTRYRITVENDGTLTTTAA